MNEVNKTTGTKQMKEKQRGKTSACITDPSHPNAASGGGGGGGGDGDTGLLVRDALSYAILFWASLSTTVAAWFG